MQRNRKHLNSQLPRNRSVNRPIGNPVKHKAVYVFARTFFDFSRIFIARLCIQIRRNHIVAKRIIVRSQLHAVRDLIYHRQRMGLVYITATQIQFDAIPDDLVFGIGSAVVLLVPIAAIVRCFLGDRARLCIIVSSSPALVPGVIGVNLCTVHKMPRGIVRHIRRFCHRWNVADGASQNAQLLAVRPAKMQPDAMHRGCIIGNRNAVVGIVPVIQTVGKKGQLNLYALLLCLLPCQRCSAFHRQAQIVSNGGFQLGFDAVQRFADLIHDFETVNARGNRSGYIPHDLLVTVFQRRDSARILSNIHFAYTGGNIGCRGIGT